MFLLQGRAMVRVQRLTMVNAYLRPFPNYEEVPLVSIAILVRPELRVTFGRPFLFHAIYHFMVPGLPRACRARCYLLLGHGMVASRGSTPAPHRLARRPPKPNP